MIYPDGIHCFATAYRIDDPVRDGWKQWVCGNCVQEHATMDPGKMAGHGKCELCGGCFGSDDAYERADELLSRICPVAARQRHARLMPKESAQARTEGMAAAIMTASDR